MKSLIFIIGLAVSGCALAPTYIAPELEHMSHITQHGAMGTHNEYIKDAVAIAQITAHWDVGQAFVEVSEGIALNRKSGEYAYGEIYGPREQFTAKIGYKFLVK